MAVSRPQLAIFLLGCYCLYTAVTLRRVVRPNFNGSPFFEDTAAGE